MKGLKGVRLGLIGAVAVVLMIGAGLLVAQVSAQDETISIGSATAAPGEQVSVDLEALNMGAPGLGAWTIDTTYDPDVVSAEDCTGGEVNSVCNTDYADDTVRVTGASAMGEEGDSVLSTITFECGDAEGTSDLVLTLNVVADATVGAPADIDAAAVDGSITCEVPPEPTATTEAPPEATATTVVVAPPPTGTGGSDGGSALGWLIAVLAGAGVAGIAGFGALRLRARRS